MSGELARGQQQLTSRWLWSPTLGRIGAKPMRIGTSKREPCLDSPLLQGESNIGFKQWTAATTPTPVNDDGSPPVWMKKMRAQQQTSLLPNSNCYGEDRWRDTADFHQQRLGQKLWESNKLKNERDEVGWFDRVMGGLRADSHWHVWWLIATFGGLSSDICW